jgi:23S rRNA pseudouridine955/2504/2580 synthase
MKNSVFTDLILYEDEDYIIINKPPYISTLADRSSDLNILDQAKEYIATAQVCHRLDKETSGALAIAKHPEAYQSLAVQLEERKVKKTYHAVADGIHDFQHEKIDLSILATGKGVARIDRKGKPAQTLVQALEAFKLHTLLACYPVTGRLHQIRVHLAHWQAPIAGDGQYGGKPIYLSALKRNFHLKKDTEELPLIKRVALHAKALQFKGLDGQPVSVEAPYPKDFAVMIKQLEKYR